MELFDDFYYFSEGYSVAHLKEDIIEKPNWVYVDKYLACYGKDENDWRFEEAYPFHEGLAKVKINGKYGFIDRDFKLAIPAEYDSAESFNRRLAKVTINSSNVKVVSYIDRRGKTVFQTIAQ